MKNWKICLTVFASLLLASCATASANDVSFKNDVMPLFMRGGCNSGSCHGASRGKDGFKLSLFGYDPEGDYYRLVEEQIGRRVNLAVPESSLLLDKAAGRVPHTGGTIFKEQTKNYQTLKAWIAAGAPRDQADAKQPVRIELSPTKITFDRPGSAKQGSVTAFYSDGSSADVTGLALYMTNNESVAAIDNQATITAGQAGGTHVFARFDKFTVGCEVVVLSGKPFTWPEPTVNNYIDDLVLAKLKELELRPSGLCSDEQFLRRVTIDLVGQLPTETEYKQFLSSSSPTKRADLVDELMSRDAFGELWAAKWGEWLRIYTDTNPGSGTAMKAGWNYYQWLREAMIAGMPWDELSRELLTGNGSNFRNPQSNYYTMLPQGKLEPKKLGEDTAQLFLGLRTQCAQCHNHPFDRWTIDDYYSFTSFFTGVRRKHGSEAREYYTFIDVDAEPAKHLVDERPMPHRFLGGDVADVKDKDPRRVLAQWMCAPDNQLFRRNLANRIWDHFFGRGIVHPVDDVRISNPASNEPLLEELGRRLAVDYQFSAKKLVRDICLSRTYQLSPTTTASNVRDDTRFSHAYLRRLRSDVLFDCISQSLDLQPKFRRSTATRAVVMFEGGRNDNFNSYFFSTFGQAKRESVCTCETKTDASLSQALHLINGKTIDDAFRRNPQLIPSLVSANSSIESKVRRLYVRMLTRQPSADELANIMMQSPESSDQKQLSRFFENVTWALLNSSEFLFNH